MVGGHAPRTAPGDRSAPRLRGPPGASADHDASGDKAFVALGWSAHGLPQTYDEAAEWLARTGFFWQEWLKHGTFPDHPWRSYLQRSALTLKGLTYAPSGAVVAASTTSLPEAPGGDRNWDYRFTWIRDSTFMLWALYTLGFDEEANDFFYFVADMADDEEAQLQIMYGIGGEKRLEEQVLEHLTGYEHSKPVESATAPTTRTSTTLGRGAGLDLPPHAFARSAAGPAVADHQAPGRAGAGALARARRGIWEVRGDPKHFTSSKLMCWVAADRGARLARIREDQATADRWHEAANEIHADICANGVDERGVFVQHYDTAALDASLLLMPLVRFLPASDARIEPPCSRSPTS